MTERILLVEDDELLGLQVTGHLRDAGFETEWLRDGDEALGHDARGYALVILDLMLPGAHGLDVLKRMRERSPTPVLVLSALKTTPDKVRALSLGADDYMTKPFDLPEFEARVRALIRRGHYNAGTTMTHGRLRFDTAARRLFYGDQPIEMSARELALTELLLARQGKVVSKEQIIDQLFGFGEDVGSNAIEVYVHRVRRKLEPLGIEIRTVRGMGYLLDKPDEAA